jgi:hypothetical protein
MNKLVFALLIILAGFAIAQYTPPDAGTPVGTAVPYTLYTNGWSISCTSTGLVFSAP